MRIITGAAKGRRLVAPDTDDTRPATDRVREAVFSALGGWVVDADVLDLYAGSGSYGLEALSRGAASATFVESGRAAIEALRTNIATVGLGGTVVATTVEAFLERSGDRRYHLVFIDPPWDLPTDAVDRQLGHIDDILASRGEVVVSRRARDRAPEPPPGWELAADRRYGDARIYRYVKVTDEDVDR
ncbi:MAG TPA: 16S rRNA (guanine(966)-N(2))-methyltransferase RsmD [Acidimicrobiia bacterium]|nr:16S rRNA (guanine(966)-N(2))-methyltransferase RsmD [Acidimicrobiia bacterium]